MSANKNFQQELFSPSEMERLQGLADLARKEAQPVGLPDSAERLKSAADASIDCNGGKKLDKGKPMFHCLYAKGLLNLGAIAEYGARLYGDENWKKVDHGYERYYDAAFRHLLKASYEYLDPEMLQPHLIAAAWNCLAAAYFQDQKHELKEN